MIERDSKRNGKQKFFVRKKRVLLSTHCIRWQTHQIRWFKLVKIFIDFDLIG